ncbi:hypothetical protein MTR67_034375 [Solanum verrucosum]|uniref:Tf2-1-like SH3-like domain-containing protein n=1 Tax=Solanum verrucosum TaxID=315347 RepID=A0AAF0U7M5_SOLVR|nr:hypothetical protein MTR67_034375 [Solanum verrucosum]
MKVVMRFGKKGKLSPIYVGPYRILKRIGKVAYELELPADLAAVHPVFHISLLKKCVGDPASIVPLESVAVKDSLSYKDVPVEILDRQVRSVFACSWNSVKLEIQFSVFSGGTHGHHPRTVDGLTVCPADKLGYESYPIKPRIVKWAFGKMVTSKACNNFQVTVRRLGGRAGGGRSSGACRGREREDEEKEEKEMGRTTLLPEVFKRTHVKKKENESDPDMLVEERAVRIYEQLGLLGDWDGGIGYRDGGCDEMVIGWDG